MISIATAVGIALAALVLGFLIGRARSRSRTVVWREDPRHGVASQGGAEADGEIDQLLRNGRLIEAIKRHRELTGLGLKESKDAMGVRRRELR